MELHVHPAASELWLYRSLARFNLLSYRAKIMLVAFVGVHVPLIALATWFALDHSPDWTTLVETLVVTLAATLLGTAATLLALHQLLRPVVLTSRALRSFRDARTHEPLPTNFTDEAGTLMADAEQTLRQLDASLDALEFVDEVTGLPNRKRFTQLVQSRMVSGSPFAVAVLRFANLGRIAETLDTHLVERAARTMAQRLALRPEFSQQLARVSSSRFACLMDGQTMGIQLWDEAAAQLRAGLHACGDEFHIGEFAIQPVLQGGLSIYPDDDSDAQSLIDSAITAAAQAHAAAPVMLHSAAARQAALERFRLEQDLRRALGRDEFVLHFQPVVDVQAGRTVGAEALIRWNHPERGLIPPLAFIGVAETSGLIEPIGLWVLRQACAQVRQWNDLGMGRLRLAVNVSARQFLDPALNRHVVEAIEHYRIAPDQLEIELTETAAMVDHEHTRRVFAGLRSAGVGIAIDDFGTGYASMSYLRKLPFDKLKIDREFVTDVHRQRQNQAICGALIELSKGLDLRILAEGAESEQDVRYLAERGCTLFQGYYFSRPVPAAEFALTATMPSAFRHTPAWPMASQPGLLN